MSKLIHANTYRGLPAAQISALEAVAQATVSNLHGLALHIWKHMPMGFSYGTDFRIRRGLRYHLVIEDDSAGWWAVMFIPPIGTSPSTGPEFGVCAAKGKLRKSIAEGEVDWHMLVTEYHHGRTDLFLGVIRSVTGTWANANVAHRLDYTHPLLLTLNLAAEKLRQGQRVRDADNEHAARDAESQYADPDDNL